MCALMQKVGHSEHVTQLTLVGFWDGPHVSPGWPDVRDFVDPTWSLDERLAVYDYLRRGRNVAACMGFSGCRFCGQQNGSSDYSDGVYVWPEGLGHYVLAHDVRLPSALVRHILATIAQEPPIDDRLDADAEWWKAYRPDAGFGSPATKAASD